MISLSSSALHCLPFNWSISLSRNNASVPIYFCLFHVNNSVGCIHLKVCLWWIYFASLNATTWPLYLNFIILALRLSWLNNFCITPTFLQKYVKTSLLIFKNRNPTHIFLLSCQELSWWRFTDYDTSGSCRFLLKFGLFLLQRCVWNRLIIFIEFWSFALYVCWYYFFPIWFIIKIIIL